MRREFDASVAHFTPRKSHLLAAFIALAALAFASDAGAQAKKSRADGLFDEGKALLQAGDWVGACTKFQASFEADPAVSTAVKLARCKEHDGKLVAALAEYGQARELNETLSQSPERKKELETLIANAVHALEPRLAKLSFRITPTPDGLEVSIDGASVPKAALAGPVAIDPGEPEVVVRAPGYREERLKPKVPEGVTHELVLGLVHETGPAPPVAAAPVAVLAAPPPAAAAAPAARPSAPPPTSDQHEAGKGSGQKTFGLVVGGAGVVALGVAGYFGIRTLVLVNRASPHCPDGICDDVGFQTVHDATVSQTIGFVALGVGAALVGTGVALYLTAPSDSEKTAVVVRLSPGAAALGGTF